MCPPKKAFSPKRGLVFAASGASAPPPPPPPAPRHRPPFLLGGGGGFAENLRGRGVFHEGGGGRARGVYRKFRPKFRPIFRPTLRPGFRPVKKICRRNFALGNVRRNFL